MSATGRRAYPYGPSWKAMAFCFLFFTGASLVLAWKSVTNLGGIRLLRLVEWGPAGASRFYAILSVATLLLALAGLFGLWKRFAVPQEIVVDDEGIEVPKSILSRERVRVPYSEIEAVRVAEVMNERTLRVVLRDRSTREIARNHLPSEDAFRDIAATLQERAGLVPPSGDS